MKDAITILCRATPGDALIVEVGKGTDPTVRIQSADLTDDASSGPVIIFDRDKARELFNWLGVWLLTQ